MFRSLQTRESWPSFERRRLTPPTSTPSVVESMNVVSVKSTTTSLPPCPITSSNCCLNSGAVYRSTSPASEMTYDSPPSCSVLMSKFMRPPGIGVGPGGILLFLLLCRRGRCRRQLLDQRLDLRRARRAGVQLEVPLVGLDGGRRVSALLRGLRELEPVVR